ncbi:MAG: hypothetical protein HC924_04545 [Synechococcaceae cyanobacterium SM2_3_2]|nr:hypothetical protein [Synechococcaceae cyanobacterium SM2_3_2]
MDPFLSPNTLAAYSIQQAKNEALGILAGIHLSHLEQEVIAKFRELSPVSRQRVARGIQNLVAPKQGGEKLPPISQSRNITTGGIQ